MKDIYQGVYINLARSTKRKTYIENHLKELGLFSYFRRFEAFDGDSFRPSEGNAHLTSYEKACFASHLEIMQKLANDDKHLHIIEDDAKMDADIKPVLHQMLTQNFAHAKWDMLFLGLYHPIESYTYEHILQKISGNSDLHVFDMKQMQSSIFGAFSLVIHKNSIGKIVQMLERDLYKMQIDHLYRSYILNGALKGVSFLPMLAYPKTDVFGSDMKNRTIPEDLLFSEELFACSLKALMRGANMQEVYDEIATLATKNSITLTPPKQNLALDDVLKALIQSAQPVLDRRTAYLAQQDK